MVNKQYNTIQLTKLAISSKRDNVIMPNKVNSFPFLFIWNSFKVFDDNKIRLNYKRTDLFITRFLHIIIPYYSPI